ncbi:AMP deaminase protein [Rutstroemia sp. NJR-2017a BBW]|nr:AMP deaminase protein [Rutstroemia sp. NJR-2017a BBW]
MSATSPPPRSRFLPTPIEETVKKSRKFAIEPVETTARSTKKEKAEEVENTTARQDFAPAPAPAKKRFLPQPVETTFKSSKAKPESDLPPTPELTPEPNAKARSAADPPAPRRKFAPQLIETIKRSKKATVPGPATLPTDKTDITPISAASDASSDCKSTLPLPLPRRQPSMRPHNNSRRSTRQNSYQPELDTIESSSDEEENEKEEEESPPSISESLDSAEDPVIKMYMARTRESCDERFSGYLLALAAKAAEKKLQEQALAAFPNESAYEIVEHFYDREIETASDEGSVEGVGLLIEDAIQRKPTEVGWAAKEMQQHTEKLNRLREEETNKDLIAEVINPSFKDPFWTNGMTDNIRPSGTPADKLKEAELARMRNAASPPMLGVDLKFRMCPSPKATKFESDQRHDIQHHRVEDGRGLWGGYCIAEEVGEYLSPSIVKRPELIQTPYHERDDPFSSAFSNGVSNGNENDARPRLNKIRSPEEEEALLREFNDTFVTQVYNYLSLGYPSLARQYDEELARISRIPEEELRIDDKEQNVKGHIGLVSVDGGLEQKEGRSIKGERSEGGYGMRWKALRTYILDWARQHPSMSNGAADQNAWGVRARRGSWAI